MNSGADRLEYAESFRDLRVYQKARELSRAIFRLSQDFPRDERFSLTDQIRRASRSVGAQIAEAWAKRRYENHFIAKLTDADAEQMETQHWLGCILDCAYSARETLRPPMELCLEIGRMLNSMMRNASNFCESTNRLKEPDPEYYLPYSDLPLDF